MEEDVPDIEKSETQMKKRNGTQDESYKNETPDRSNKIKPPISK
jgi:hypothetical protein